MSSTPSASASVVRGPGEGDPLSEPCEVKMAP